MSETNDFTNDARLTAYALGELEGTERAEVEALLAKDEAARRVVEEIRATATLVGAELGNVAGPALTDAQRAAISAKAGAAKPVFRMRPVYWMATAASVAAVVVGVSLIVGSEEKQTASARAPQTTSAPKLVTETYSDEEAPDGADMAWTAPEEGQLREASASFSATDRQRAVAAAQLKQLSDANAALNAADTRTRGDLDRLARAQTVVESQNDPVTLKEVVVPGASSAPGVVYAEGGGGGGGGQRRVSSGASFAGVGAKRFGGFVPLPAPKPGEPAAPPVVGGPQTPGGGSAGGPATGGPEVTPFVGGSGGGAGSAEEAEKSRLASLGYVAGGDRDGSTASYAHLNDNPFRLVKDAPLSTFSIDVDTASYSNVRRFLQAGQLPPPGAVRLEEMLNYFPYDYAPPTDGRPFAVRVDVAGCPWKMDHRLVRVGLKGKVVATAARPAANLVFLLDVSGSMQPANRLPLIIQSMKLLVGQLEARDRVAIVVYAGESGVALPSTSCEEKGKILAALDALHAGGSTNGASGIQLAYDIAGQNKIDGGVNRVVLATDGDFNVGVTDESSLVKLIKDKAAGGTFLSVLGVGDDNFKDSTMEKLADCGNGNYAYIDTLKEGQKVLVEQTSGTLVTIAKDVKLQVEFNPAQVGSYRLIGYEDRVLATEDFKDDKKDAGEIGAGHTVTALYEVVPPGALATESVGVEPLKYQTPPAPTGTQSRELLTVKLRWKEPNADVSTPMEVPVVDEGVSYSAASPDFKFAASVAAFGICLRGSPHKGNISMSAIVELATEGAANDPGGYRAEFVGLVKRAAELGAK